MAVFSGMPATFDFDPAAQGYSRRNAFLLAQAAAAAYDSPEVARAWALSQGLDEEFSFFSTTGVNRRCDTQGFIAQNADVVVVAFRGTQPNVPVDWIVDFEAHHVNWGHPTGKVHKGFYQALQAVWGVPLGGTTHLPDRVINRGDRTVWVTGHSLGGALAQLCAAELALVSQVPVQGVYTFGQPRVGDQAFAEALNSAIGPRVFRHINDRDIVPRVPLFNMQFRHCGCEYFYDPAGALTERAGCVEDLAGALRLAKLALSTAAALNMATAVGRSLLGRFTGGVAQDPLARSEDSLRDAYKALLASGTEAVSDHDMRKHYLARLRPE